MTTMFWGLRLEPGKRYSTTVDKSFHVSMAALDVSTVKNDKDVQSVMLEEGESNIPFILCNLQKPKVLQCHLDLNFVSGDRVTFFCRGNGCVHLTGYLMPDDEDDDDFAKFGEEVEEEEEELDEEDEGSESELTAGKGKGKENGVPSKRKAQGDTVAAKKKKLEQVTEEASDDSNDEEEEEEEEEQSDEEDSSELDGEVEEETEDESKVAEEKSKPAALPTSSSDQKGKKQQNKQQAKAAGDQEKKDAVPMKTLEGGVIIKDLKVGNGAICKPGRMVTVYYTGKLKSNNKVFDSYLPAKGPGFKFRVGRGEVIKGWDVGVAGMKVGGKRMITCPPSMAYGKKGMPPIPPNSTLVFEVELKAVN